MLQAGLDLEGNVQPLKAFKVVAVGWVERSGRFELFGEVGRPGLLVMGGDRD